MKKNGKRIFFVEATLLLLRIQLFALLKTTDIKINPTLRQQTKGNYL